MSISNGLSLGLQELDDGGICFRHAFAEEIKPPPTLSVSEWADAYRIVSQKSSSEVGPWRTARTPYTREPMDCLSVHSPVVDVVLKWGTQLGKTETGNNWIGYIIDYNPSPTMLIWPTSVTAKRNSKQRLTPLIEETPALARKVKPSRSRDSGNTTLMKEFDNGVLIIAGANSANDIKSNPIQNLFGDEVDEWPDDLDDQGDPWQLAVKRTTNFPRRKRLQASSPTVQGFSRIDASYQASDQRHYHVPCPECQQLQWLKWAQMRWQLRKRLEFHCTGCGVISDGKAVTGETFTCPACDVEHMVTEQSVIEKETDEILAVWYECEHCQGQILEHHKTWMLDKGLWIADNPGPDRAAGFHLSSLYSPLGWFSWREAVKDYLAAQGNEVLYKVFVNTVLAETYVDRTSEQPDVNEIKDRAEATYRLGKVPAGGLMLSASGDVQHNRIEVLVKAYGRGEESWLVDYQVFYGDTEGDAVWEEFDEYLQKKFPHVNGGELSLAAAAVDSGYRAHKVYDFCRRRARRHVFAIKGMPNEGRPPLGKPTLQDVDYRGKTVRKGVKLWGVGQHVIKTLIYSRLKKTEGEGCMHFPVGLPDEYFNQLTVERLVTFYNKAGKPRREWRKKPNERNEALDLEVYNYAAALYAGLKRKNWDKLEQQLNVKQMDLLGGQAPEPTAPDVDGTLAEPEASVAAAETKAPARKKTVTAPRRRRKGGFISNY